MTKKQESSVKPASQPNIPTRLKKQLQRELRAEADELQGIGANSGALTNSGRDFSENSQLIQPFNRRLAKDAAILLGVAAAIAVIMLLVAVFMPSGREAIKGIGGFVTGPVPVFAVQVALALDSVFPMFYGAGVVVFATSLRTRGNRPLVRLILITVLAVVLSDFAENALVFRFMTDSTGHFLQPTLTLMKYAGIAFVSVVLSAIIVPYDAISNIVRFAARFVFPACVAILIAGIGGEDVRSALAVSFPISLLLLAQLAHNMSHSR